MSNIYVDFEMTGLTMKDKPISIGVYLDNDKTFYAEFNDYDIESCSDWIKENVITNLKYNESESCLYYIEDGFRMKGNTYEIGRELYRWLNMNCEMPIQFVSDVCHYDFCHFLELFGGALSDTVNGFINPVAYDVNDNLAIMKSCSNVEAFDINREEFLKELLENEFETIFDDIQKHNALFDAKVIHWIYNCTEWCRITTDLDILNKLNIE